MTDLIKSNTTYTSLKLAEITGKQHVHVMRDIRTEIESIGEEIALSIFGWSSYTDGRDRNQPMYTMNKKGWLQMGARYDAKTRFAIIDYMEKLENKLLTPKSFSEALFLAAEQQKTIEALKETTDKQNKLIQAKDEIIESNKPKVLFAETVSGSSNLILIRELAKLLSKNGFEIGQNRLFAWMRDNGYLMKNNEPYQNYVAQGLFEVTERIVGDLDNIVTVRTTRVTGKGQTYFTNKIIPSSSTQEPHHSD